MPHRSKNILTLIRATFVDFVADDCPNMAASVAYYTLFSLPGLLVVVTSMAGAVFGQEAATGELQMWMGQFMGPESAAFIAALVKNAADKTVPRGVVTSVGLVALLFGGTAAFAQVQRALNRAWCVRPDPRLNPVRVFFLKRLISFAMIIAIGGILTISVLISTAISALQHQFSGYLDQPWQVPFLQSFNILFFFVVTTVVFAAIFRFLPDAEIEWREVWFGAMVTSVLITAGKYVLGLYLATSTITTVFGPAGSLALFLLWIYYSTNIFFLGAEFTEIWAHRFGNPIVPSKGAVAYRVQIQEADTC